MTIREIEARTGLPRANVRYYESEGLIRPTRGENGYRNYSEEDCQTLLKIKLLRQLDCSLEDIRAVQLGELSLEDLLARQLAGLRARQSELEQARLLCEQLQADRVEWDTIQPERYLSWSLPPVRTAVADTVRFRLPWRRYLARSLDLALCGLLWNLFLALALRENILQRGRLDLLDNFAALGLMLLLEPLFLHKFGATPGKALLFLRLTRSDGSYFSYAEGFHRTLRVILMGMGLSLPLLSFVTGVLGYYRCRQWKEQPWALEDEAWSDGTKDGQEFRDIPGAMVRVACYAGVFLLIAALQFAAFLFAAAPPHRGALTPGEFVENFNHLLDFAEAPEGAPLHLSSDGSWKYLDPMRTFSSWGRGESPVPFQLQTRDGLVSAVSFSLSDTESYAVYPTQQITHTISALLGQREYLPSSQCRQLLPAIRAQVEGTRSWEVDGWTVTVTLDATGYYRYLDSYFIDPDSDVARPRFFFAFRMERT